jgi:predicted  nucleic acid-binding Zn-ribbon protein
MLCFDAEKMYRKWIRDIADCQDIYNGHVQHTAPFYGGGGGPGGWGGAMVFVPYSFYKAYGDKELIKKYTKQQENVRNNREFESLNKEIEFQNLEIQLCERKIKDSIAKGKERHQQVEIAKNLLSTRQGDLDAKKIELEEITKETEIEEVALQEKSKELEQAIDERYLKAYKRIRLAARNGLAVVGVDRDACGGCFNKIPHQRQMEIKMHKKVIVCEHCGRILIDEDIREKSEERVR